MSTPATIDWRRAVKEAGPYPPEAYDFLRAGLAHTVEMVHGAEARSDDASRHVSGHQLCLGLRDFAIGQFGLLAGPVLRRWNIRATDDFGRMVFNLVDAGLMRTSDEDKLSDFAAVYDFDEAFPLPSAHAAHN